MGQMSINNIKKEVRPNAEVMLTGEIAAKAIEGRLESIVTKAQKEIELPGFRKGKAPREMVREAYGENALWKEAAEETLRNELEDILKKEEVAPIAPLALSLKNPEKGSDVAFEIVATVAPKCELGNYKEEAQKALKEVKQLDQEKEKGEAKRAFRTQARGISKLQRGDVAEGDTKKIEDEADTALSDEEAKFLGFETGAAFELFLEEEAGRAVTSRENQLKRSAVAEAILSNTSCEVPRMFIDEEARALVDATKRDVAARGFEWSAYLKQTGKDETMILNELKPVAEKRVKLDLIFGEIIRAEEIKPEESDKEQEDAVAHRMVQEGVPHERAHQFAREQIIREKVWQLLLGETKKTKDKE